MKRIAISLLAFSSAGLIGLAVHEDYARMPYQDSVGKWTDGYGNTVNVVPGKPVPHARALITLAKNVDAHATEIKRCFGDVPLYQHEFDAFVDLAFNVGAPTVCRSSIPQKLRACNYAAACASILSFDKITVNGEKVSCKDPANNCRGIVKRRQETYNRCMGATDRA
ncbi:MAG: lysozyme [Oxalobacter sp.]|nr:MAG: lysozyme [Oxalobacter sp.]